MKRSLNYQRVPLSKALLLSVPVGTILISNCFGPDRQPVFTAEITAKSDRDALWQQAVSVAANGRLCVATRSKSAASDWSTAPQNCSRKEQLLALVATGGDAGECAVADLLREFPSRA